MEDIRSSSLFKHQFNTNHRSNRYSKSDISIFLGNVLDHFDTSLYAFLAPLIGKLFFPNYDPIVQLILAYSVFTTSLITRPLGSFIFGNLARKHGPLLGLSYSLIGMSLPTLALGLLPDFSQLGFMAPLLLVLIRMIRGIFAAGENTIAKLYILEGKSGVAAKKASFDFQASSMLGMVLASLISAIIVSRPEPYLWRICFCLGGSIGLLGYYLRSISTASIQRSSTVFNTFQVSSLSILWAQRMNVFRVAMMITFSHVTYAIPFVFLNGLMPFISSISQETMLSWNTALLILDLFLIPFFGKLTLPFQGEKIMIFAVALMILTIFPLFSALPDASLVFVIALRIWVVLLGVLFLCPLNVWLKDLFNHQEDQYLLVGIGNAIGSALGRMIPALCLGMWHYFNMILAPAVLIVLFAMAVLYCIYTVPLKVRDVQGKYVNG